MTEPPERCMFCGAELSPSHIAVRRDRVVVGAVCGRHSLRDIVLIGPHRSAETQMGERFMLNISLVEDA